MNRTQSITTLQPCERNGEESFEAWLASVDRQLEAYASLVEELGIKSRSVRDISDRLTTAVLVAILIFFSSLAGRIVICRLIGGRRLMSALGQKRTSIFTILTSAVSQKRTSFPSFLGA